APKGSCWGTKVTVSPTDVTANNINIICEVTYWGLDGKNWNPWRKTTIYSDKKLDKDEIKCVKYTPNETIVQCQGDNCDKEMGVSRALLACSIQSENEQIGKIKKI
ncbi:hypothetical protein PMAYCL1PPCAC_22673, partial [Pristionchus mayeri]